MSAINLLPRNIRIKIDLKERRKKIFPLSLFIMFVTFSIYGGIFLKKVVLQNKSNSLDLKIEEFDNSLDKELSKKESLVADNKIKKANALMLEHYYYSKVFKFLQKTVNSNIYLNDGSFSQKNDDLFFDFSATAENYEAAIEQIASFKNHYLIDNIQIAEVSVDVNQEAIFKGVIKFRKDIIMYHENYWNFGLAVVSSKTDRNLKINDFKADLIKNSDGGSDLVKIKFKGVAYDGQKIAVLENEFLKGFKEIIKEIFIRYNKNNNSKLDLVDFEGEMLIEF